MSTPTLPRPEDCGWYEADTIARTPRALAHDLSVRVGPPPAGRFSGRRYARWQGQQTLINGITFRGIAYRRRANTIEAEAK